MGVSTSGQRMVRPLSGSGTTCTRFYVTCGGVTRGLQPCSRTRGGPAGNPSPDPSRHRIGIVARVGYGSGTFELEG
jgi:hypothetical protein